MNTAAGSSEIIVASPRGSSGDITTSGTLHTGDPCTIDLTDVAALSIEACELLCATAWQSPYVAVIGGSETSQATLRDHFVACDIEVVGLPSRGDQS